MRKWFYLSRNSKKYLFILFMVSLYLLDQQSPDLNPPFEVLGLERIMVSVSTTGLMKLLITIDETNYNPSLSLQGCGKANN